MEEKIAYKPSNIELKENGEFIINDEGIKELQEEICRIHLTSPYTVLVSKT